MYCQRKHGSKKEWDNQTLQSLTLIPSNLLTNSKNFSTMRERKRKSLNPSPPKSVFFALRSERLKFGPQQLVY
ncbi:hypothetical protein ACSBR1_035661 [Camellia fascicularis]